MVADEVSSTLSPSQKLLLPLTVITGAPVKTNPSMAAIPDGVFTDIIPELPLPTTAVIVVDETTVNDVAGMPPNETSVAPVKLLPVMVTIVPLLPLVGVNDVITGPVIPFLSIESLSDNISDTAISGL